MSTAQQRRALGDYGERIAARWLVEQGMVLLDRNWRCRAGEVDLVLDDRGTVVVCEVKTRRSAAFGHPVEAVTPRKAERLGRLAQRWLDAHDRHGADVRVDVVAVLQDGRGAGAVEHVRGVA